MSIYLSSLYLSLLSLAISPPLSLSLSSFFYFPFSFYLPFSLITPSSLSSLLFFSLLSITFHPFFSPSVLLYLVSLSLSFPISLSLSLSPSRSLSLFLSLYLFLSFAQFHIHHFLSSLKISFLFLILFHSCYPVLCLPLC